MTTAVRPSTITASSGGQSTLIQLKHGQSFTVEGLPVTAAYSVEEKEGRGLHTDTEQGRRRFRRSGRSGHADRRKHDPGLRVHQHPRSRGGHDGYHRCRRNDDIPDPDNRS